MVAYLSTVLKQNNYHASTDPVTTTTWTTTAPSVLTATLPQGVTVSFDEGTQFIAARYSASGNVVAPITALAAIVDTCSYDAVPAGAGTIAVVAWCVPCVHDAVPAAAVTDATTCAEAVRPRPGGGDIRNTNCTVATQIRTLALANYAAAIISSPGALLTSQSLRTGCGTCRREKGRGVVRAASCSWLT